MAALALRRAADSDKDFFSALRNDPTAQRMSRRGPVSHIEHDYYWARWADIRVVITYGEGDVGIIRIQHDGTVSIVIHPEYRGGGMGGWALTELPKWLADQGYTIPTLWAEVAPENAPSQRAFIRSGWSPILFECRVR